MTRHQERKRISTGIDGLGTILFGGLLRGSTHLGFFEERSLADSVFYVDGYHALAEEGPRGFSALVQELVRSRRPGLLVLDCLDTAKGMLGGAIPFRALLHELGSLATAAGCATILLGHGAGERVDEAQPSSDIIIDLSRERVGKRTSRQLEVRTSRQLEVRKSRGSASFEGRHSFIITADGMQVFPRTEALFAASPVPETGDPEARLLIDASATKINEPWHSS